jgi:predicted transcriptional regulator
MSLEKYEARIARGHIMQILKIAYPGPASLELLEVTLNDRSCNTSPAIIRGYVDYLAEKGYVHVWEEKDDVLNVQRTLVKLTAHGVDLMEGNISPEPGVNI